jgi:hypothetical protein
MKRTFFVIAAALLAACSSASTRSLPPVPGAPAPTHRARASLTLRIRVPRKPPHKAHYVSPATAGLTMDVTGPNGYHSSTVAGLTPASPGCSGGAGGTACTLTLGGLAPCAASANCYTVTLATYDAVTCASTCTIPGSAHELSAAQSIPFYVASATANQLTATLGGIPKSILVSPLVAGYLQGDAHKLSLWGPTAQSLAIEVLDADGNPIVGPGAPTLSATSSASSLVVSGPTTAAPNIITLRAPASGNPPVVTPGVVNVVVAAQPASQSGASTLKASVPVTIAHSILYVGGTNSITAFYDGNGTQSATIAGSNTGLVTQVNSLAVGANGSIYAVVPGGQLLEFAPGANGNVAPAISISGSNTGLDSPVGVTVDAAGRVFVTNLTSNVVTAYSAGANGNVLPSFEIAGTSTLLSSPIGEALDSQNTLYVANEGNGIVTTYAAGSQNNVLTASIGGSSTNLQSIAELAIAPDGTICVISVVSGLQAIVEFAPGSSGNVAPLRTISGAASQLTDVSALVADAGGTLYAANDVNVTEYAAGTNGNVAPSGVVNISPISLAVVPAAFTP